MFQRTEVGVNIPLLRGWRKRGGDRTGAVRGGKSPGGKAAGQATDVGASAKSTLYVSTRLAFSQRACASVNFFSAKKTYKINVCPVNCFYAKSKLPPVSLGGSVCFLTLLKRVNYCCVSWSPRCQDTVCVPAEVLSNDHGMEMCTH